MTPNKIFILTVKDTQKAGAEAKEIYRGTELGCLRKFQSVCGFSFANHKKYSYLHYTIKKA